MEESGNATSEPDYEETPPFFWNPGWNRFVHGAFSWLFPIILLSGGLLNLACFIVTAANRKTFPRNSRLYMLLISFTDAVILLVKGPIYYLDVMATLVTDPWPGYRSLRTLSPVVMRIYYIITYLTMFGAPFFQLGLTVDRAIAVCFPLKAKQLMNWRNSMILLAVVMVLALSFPALTIYLTEYDPELGVRIVNDKVYHTFYTQFELYVGRLLLVILLIVGTVLICVMLLRSSRGIGESTGGGGGDDKRKGRAIRLSLVLVILNVNFLLFTVPWSLLSAIETFGLVKWVPPDQLDTAFESLNVLLYLNSAFNWVAYFMGQGFRSHFVATFHLRRCGCGDTSASGSGSMRNMSSSVAQTEF